ncbi:XLF-domain-containing protein [Hypoxylon cercidicola]|nr:XLF-domain-containing protein [Hypoxylon cercidicola]
MTFDSTWHPLPAFPDLPSLMISLKLTASSYTLHVTDLANVWVESLDRKGILLRSLQEDTSIDLSDGDPAQWAVFLSKLNAAFDPTSADHGSTSLSLAASSPERTVEGGLVLHVTCVLPEPLKPLRWPVYLTKCPPVGLASELVLPLIRAQHERNIDIQDLVARLQEKDVVITKLVDKLEAMHTGLEHVFNALSGKRKPSRAAVEEKVKGLAAFNESDWRSRVNANRELPRDVPSLIHKVFTEVGLHCKADSESGTYSQLNDWWTKLDSNQISAIKSQNETPKKAPVRSPQDTKTVAEKDYDDFQVQVTPPHLQSQGRTISSQTKVTDDTTDDDGSLVEIPDSHPTPSKEKPRARIGGVGGKKMTNKDNPSSQSQSSRTVPAEDYETVSESDQEAVQLKSPKRADPRLGTIGRSKEPSPLPARSPSPAPPPTKDGDETASGSDSSEDEPPKSRSRPPPSPIPRRRVELGRIGGKPKSPATPEATELPKATISEADSPEITASPAKPTGRKLGIIGKKPESDGKHQRSASPDQAEESETDEQRTERRRAELAKELERKAAAPTKKKRRF